MKLCRNCHWCVTRADDKTMQYARCLAPENVRIPDLVHGGMRPFLIYCSSHRATAALVPVAGTIGFNEVSDICGIEGRWYSEVDPPEAPEAPEAGRDDGSHGLTTEQRNAGDPCMVRR